MSKDSQLEIFSGLNGYIYFCMVYSNGENMFVSKYTLLIVKGLNSDQMGHKLQILNFILDSVGNKHWHYLYLVLGN